MDQEQNERSRNDDGLPVIVGRRARRKIRARRHERDPIWRGLGTMGMVGWSVAIPTILGTFLGVWFDRRWPSSSPASPWASSLPGSGSRRSGARSAAGGGSTMTDLLDYGLAVAAGGLAGFLYFAGLWLTIRRLPASRRPVLLLVASFLLRTVVVLALFYLVARAGLLPLAVAALVFVLVRFFLTHRWGVRAGQQRRLRGSHPDAG